MNPVNLRPQLASHLQQRLQAFGEGFRHNLALIGPPGSGKTFQLQQLLARPPSKMFLLYCPLYRESCRSFLQRLLSTLLQVGEASPGLAGSTIQPLEAHLQRIETHCPKTAAAVRPIEGLLARRFYGEAFSRALDTIPILIEERRQPCAFILDEFLFLEELGLVHAFHELGKRVMTWSSALFILASSSPYRARTILRERLQLLFGQFELLTLDTLEPNAAAAWAQQELRGVRGTKAMIPFLIRWLGAYPWYLAVFLKRLRELAALSKRADCTEALFLQTAWDVLGSAEGSLHQWCASRTEGLPRGRLGTRAIEALLQIAQGVRTTTEIGKRMSRAGLPAALQLLVEHDLAQRNGTCWTVTDPALRCWLSTVLFAQRSEGRLDHLEVRDRFERSLRSLWAGWIQADQLSFVDQVAGLFTKFADETVSLDSKTGRLPKFETLREQPLAAPSAGAYLVADAQGKRWCASVQEQLVDEGAIAQFDAFCRRQTPKPSRKVVVTKTQLDQNARLLAKTANMWVWESDDLSALMGLYGQL